MTLIERLEAADYSEAWMFAPDVHLELFGGPLSKAAKCPPYTTSIDAALTLAERVLDGDFSYDLFHDFGGFNRAKIYAITDGPVIGESRASTMCLALCASILKAKETK